MQQLTRVDPTDLRIIASRWEASANELNQPLAPVGLGPRGQASVAAVRAAHTDVTAFAVGLAARVSVRASLVGEAGAHFRANETSSEVRLQEDLDNLWKWMREQGVERSEGYGKLPGEMRQLPDGTIVGRREAAGSTKMPALDIRVPDGGGYLKVHINPTCGGVPDIPAPIRPAAPEPARTPFEPRPVAAPTGTVDTTRPRASATIRRRRASSARINPTSRAAASQPSRTASVGQR